MWMVEGGRCHHSARGGTWIREEQQHEQQEPALAPSTQAHTQLPSPVSLTRTRDLRGGGDDDARAATRANEKSKVGGRSDHAWHPTHMKTIAHQRHALPTAHTTPR
mmetsp:Transcript_951/g.3123  ORF Transcript_951/g.3123 Transcript_951/m.3123 type:complete len:106 (-) Transcript_951:47-364(-)